MGKGTEHGRRNNYIRTLCRGGGTKKKVGGLTLPLNDCTEAGVQGLHSEDFFPPLASEKVVGLSPPTPQSGGAKAPSAPPAPPPLTLWNTITS